MSFLYGTTVGRCFVKIVTEPFVSKFASKYLSSGISKIHIKPFIRKNNIDMQDYEEEHFNSFNSFFCRQIKHEKRPIDMIPSNLISPCDGKISAYKITENTVFPIKQSAYSVNDLLKDRTLSKIYNDGTCLVFRLTPDNYHRYCYIDDGNKGKNTHINGRFNTVRPIALRSIPVFKENSREYTELHTNNFGNVVQIEVGALLVGKIDNYHQEGLIRRGQEKGRFLYGGSTIILLFEKDKVSVDEKFFSSTLNGLEVPVKLGEKIGISLINGN